jgi:hypothetical protein
MDGTRLLDMWLGHSGAFSCIYSGLGHYASSPNALVLMRVTHNGLRVILKTATRLQPPQFF